MHGCDYRSEVLAWAQRYTASPPGFERAMRRSMPFLLIVVDELERRNLPGEFAMLPFVESRYEPVVAQGNRPAGMWQLMPVTARGNGLEVGGTFDERLDPVAATRVSLGLIERYAERFDDWRLANMAFNAGEFRVLRLLEGREASDLSAAQLARLTFSNTTHDHLDKLLALSCVIDDPGRFSVDLPEPTVMDRLVEVQLNAAIDLRVAARLIDVDEAEMLRWNAAWRGAKMSGTPPFRLLIPVVLGARLDEALQTIPQARWREWRMVRTRSTADWVTLAADSGIAAEMLARINRMDAAASVSIGASLLLPGREPSEQSLATADRGGVTQARSHVVRRGDTLGAIARRYGVRLAQLMSWNGKHLQSTLRPGDRLWLVPASPR